MKNTGKILQQLREAKGWTQKRVASMANISQERLSQIEKGKRTPKETIIKVWQIVKPGHSLDSSIFEASNHYFQVCRAEMILDRMSAEAISRCCDIMELLTYKRI